jgi:hypothetical protein
MKAGLLKSKIHRAQLAGNVQHQGGMTIVPSDPAVKPERGGGIGEGSFNLGYPGGNGIVYNFNPPLGEPRWMESSTTRNKRKIAK